MNAVRAAPATKSGNPLCDMSLVELTLREIPPATVAAVFEIVCLDNEVAA
jgi:hypothetical protein